MAPPPRSRFRVPSLKLKSVFSPRRVMVRSLKVSSARDSIPVRTAVPLLMRSFRLALRGAAWTGSSFTSLMMRVSSASVSTSAGMSRARQSRPRMNEPRRIHFIRALGQNEFFMAAAAGLELHVQRQEPTEVCDLVVKDLVIGLVSRQAADGARRHPVGDVEVRARGKDFADIHPIGQLIG